MDVSGRATVVTGAGSGSAGAGTQGPARTRRAAAGGVALLALACSPGAASAETSVRLAEGVTLTPYALEQLDAGSIDQDREGGQAAGVNGRRLRLGGRANIRDQVEVGFIWDFGGTAGGRQALFEAKASYLGLKPFHVTVGVFKVGFGLESMQGAGATLFMERASISTITRNLAAGIRREAVEIGADGERYNAVVALTAGQAGPGRDGDQRAVAGRIASLAYSSDTVSVHLGVSGEYVFHGAREPGQPPSITLSDREELQIDDAPSTLSTGGLRTDRIGAVGPEIGLGWQRLWLSGEYYSILGRTQAPNRDVSFNGWYAQAAYTLLGTPRRWDGKIGGWGAPKPDAGFDPRTGHWGAVELAARVSAVSLDSGTIRGGRQNVVATGVNWWPVEPLRFSVQYEHAAVSGGPSPRSVNAVAGRAQLQF
ncbi:MAG: OprO/OprP family phosphate-selective porin [Janthinobacterium lividum]